MQSQVPFDDRRRHICSYFKRYIYGNEANHWVRIIEDDFRHREWCVGCSWRTRNLTWHWAFSLLDTRVSLGERTLIVPHHPHKPSSLEYPCHCALMWEMASGNGIARDSRASIRFPAVRASDGDFSFLRRVLTVVCWVGKNDDQIYICYMAENVYNGTSVLVLKYHIATVHRYRCWQFIRLARMNNG